MSEMLARAEVSRDPPRRVSGIQATTEPFRCHEKGVQIGPHKLILNTLRLSSDTTSRSMGWR